MSVTLLKRSLEIVEDNLPSKVKKGRKSGQSTANTDSVFDLISEKQKLFGKSKQKGKSVRYEEIKRSEKLNVVDVKKFTLENADKTDENLRKLLRISSGKIDPKTTKKLIERRAKTRRYAPPEEVPKPEQSIFTDEDFKTFEKEYFSK